MNRIAILTMQHNEKWFLPLLINYYKSIGDLFVIDHSSDREWVSQFKNDCEIIYKDYPFFFNHQFMVDSVQDVYAKLQEKYDFVIYVEPDELLAYKNGSLKELFSNLLNGIYRPIGYDIVSDENEIEINFKLPLLKQRKFWIRRQIFDKPTISSESLKWSLGFHATNKQSEYIDGLYLLHLHRIDYKLNFQKTLYQSGLPRETEDIEKGYGVQNVISNKEAFDKYYYSGTREEIPGWVKELL